MAFKGAPGTSDKEVEQYLHENVGDFRPNWQSLYLDLMTMGEAGALAQITKKQGLQQISKWMRRNLTRPASKVTSGMSEIRPMTSGEKTAYKSLAKSIHQSPERFLRPVSELELHPSVAVQRASGELEEIYGSFNRVTDKAKFNLTAFAEKANIDPTKASTTFFHEVGHAMQKETGMNVPFISQNAREIHMQLFADDLERLASRTKGTVSDELVESVFDDTWSKTQQLLAGQELSAGEVASRIRNLRVNETNLRSRNPNYERMPRGSDDVMDYFSQFEIDPFEQIVKDLGGEMFERKSFGSLSEMKKGDYLDIPDVGRVRYDAPGVYGNPKWHQLTVDDPGSVVHKATFISTDESLATATQKAQDMLKKYIEGAAKRTEDFNF